MGINQEGGGVHPVNPSIIICSGTGPQRKQAKQTVATPPGGSKGIPGQMGYKSHPARGFHHGASSKRGSPEGGVLKEHEGVTPPLRGPAEFSELLSPPSLKLSPAVRWRNPTSAACTCELSPFCPHAKLVVRCEGRNARLGSEPRLVNWHHRKVLDAGYQGKHAATVLNVDGDMTNTRAKTFLHLVLPLMWTPQSELTMQLSVMCTC